MDTQFVGEHLGPGQLGHFFVITSFVAAMLSTFSYWRAATTDSGSDLAGSKSWLAVGRGSFLVHTLSIFGIFGALFYIIQNHLFEYHYAWEHSSLSLPKDYLLACFWEGQQGSFMLWSLWHCILGLVVMRNAKGLESRTMAIISLVQVALATMILGFYFGEAKLGSTPFMLLRNAMQNAPIFAMPNYMDFVTDGNGLNPSLRNYWMVIHPPILFLGFASTLIPFAYSLAALWKGDYKSFVKPVLGWSLFSGAVLGTGIMMGGAWAYESLNFGGYWAWDPVENASLVPWIILIAGLHTLLVYRSTGRALTITIGFLLLSHLLVWYSTFLTRTGILGKTSVHAFTGDGQALTYHLLVVIGVLLLVSIYLLVRRWRSLPTIKTEEETLSREFWMFIGSVILFLSSVQIILTTSIPVWAPLAKWISGKEFAPPTDPVDHYNNIQIWVAIITGLLSATVLYMKFKHTDAVTLGKRLGITAFIAAAMTAWIAWGQHIYAWQYVTLLFSACYGVVATVYYGIAVQKGRIGKLGPSVAHLGFALVLLGVLLSAYNKHAISFNITGENFQFDKKTAAERTKENMENVLLFRGVPVAMGDYMATYTGDSLSMIGKDKIMYYKVDYERKDTATGKIVERFTLYPDAFVNTKGQGVLTVNPSTKHYWNRDIFTYINGGTLDKNKTDTSSYLSHYVNKIGDTIHVNKGFLVYLGLNREIKDPRYTPKENDLAICAKLTAYDSIAGKIKEINPIYILRDKQYVTYVEDTVSRMALYARLENIIVKSQDSVTMEIKVRQTDPLDDFIVLKALVFPFINVLWIGIIIMVFGFFVSLGNLLTTGKKKSALAEGL